MRFYEKYPRACTPLSAIASKDSDRMIRHIFLWVIPALVFVAIVIIDIFVFSFTTLPTFLIFVGAAALTVLWYAIVIYASRVFDPGEFEHPTPR